MSKKNLQPIFRKRNLCTRSCD